MVHAGVCRSELIEFHGHNDFYKAVNNSSTAWLYGASGVNCSLFGIGREDWQYAAGGDGIRVCSASRYAGRHGYDSDHGTAEYYEKEIGYKIPSENTVCREKFQCDKSGHPRRWYAEK